MLLPLLTACIWDPGITLLTPSLFLRQGSGAKYRKPHAVLLPLVLPLLLTAYLWDFNPFTADWAHSRSLQWTLAACCSASLLFLSAYPESGTLRGPMLGKCFRRVSFLSLCRGKVCLVGYSRDVCKLLFPAPTPRAACCGGLC